MTKLARMFLFSIMLVAAVSVYAAPFHMSGSASASMGGNMGSVSIEVRHSFDGEKYLAIDHSVKIRIKHNNTVRIVGDTIEISMGHKTLHLNKQTFERVLEQTRHRLILVLREKLSQSNNTTIQLKMDGELYAEDDKVHVVVKAPARAKLLFFIPITVEVTADAEIDPNTNQVKVVVRKPWYWFLLTSLSIE